MSIHHSISNQFSARDSVEMDVSDGGAELTKTCNLEDSTLNRSGNQTGTNYPTSSKLFHLNDVVLKHIFVYT